MTPPKIKNWEKYCGYYTIVIFSSCRFLKMFIKIVTIIKYDQRLVIPQKEWLSNGA